MVQASENAVLSCEVSQRKAEVKWSINGKVVTLTPRIKLVSEGTVRKLIIQNAESKDTGNYICEIAGEKLTFHVKVKG